ncbi:hypothetical protein, partial [Micromonospora sp. LOL_023]|uniref:WXG100-like domain-containing protein n=1 Tax=Micromonospora sp. LOL_023 TaxID=3345418 RepID=UPI003A86D3D7
MDHSREWEKLRDALDAARAKVVQQRSVAPDVLSGRFADGVDESLERVVQNIDYLRGAVEEMRKDLKNGAADLQEAKIMIGIQLALLAIQLAWLIYSLFGALAIPAVVAGFRAVITAILRQIFVEVAQELAQEPLLMLLIQAVQNDRNYREGVNWDAIRAAAIQTVIQAGAAGLTNFGAQSLIGWAAGKVAKIDRALPDGTVFIKSDWVFRTGSILTKGGAQAAVAIPAELAGQAAVGAPIEVRWGTATSAFVSGLHESNASTPTQLAESVNLPSMTGWDDAFRPLPDDGGSVEGRDVSDTAEGRLPWGDSDSVHGGDATRFGDDDSFVGDDATLVGDDDSFVSDDATLVGDTDSVAGDDDQEASWIGEVSEQRLLGDDGSGVWSDDGSQGWATDDEDDRLLDYAAGNVLAGGGVPGLVGLGTGFQTQQGAAGQGAAGQGAAGQGNGRAVDGSGAAAGSTDTTAPGSAD